MELENIANLSENKIEAYINTYIELGDQIKALKKKQDENKEVFTAWLDTKGAKRVSTADFVATLTTRKGSFDKKAFQIAHGFKDSDLDKFKKQPSVFWTVKKK